MSSNMKTFQQLWRDMNSGVTHLVRLDSQTKVNNNGRYMPEFIPDFSGFSNSRDRLEKGKMHPSILPEIPKYLVKHKNKNRTLRLTSLTVAKSPIKTDSKVSDLQICSDRREKGITKL